MSTLVRKFPGAKVLGSAKVTINSATTTNYDFGTPNDLDLRAIANYDAGDRLLAVFTGTTGGTTDLLNYSVQDAPDNAGSIGTPATAVTTGLAAASTGDQFDVVGIEVQQGRPWIRCRVTSNGTTDTFVTSVVVLAVPSNA